MCGMQLRWLAAAAAAGPGIFGSHRLVLICKYLSLIRAAVDIPAIASIAPAVPVDRTEPGFTSGNRRLVVPVDLGVDLLHPASDIPSRRVLRMPARPVVIPVAFRCIQRKVVQVGWNAKIDPVFIHIKAEIKVLPACIDLLCAVDGLLLPGPIRLGPQRCSCL